MKISITYLYVILRYGYPHRIEDVFRALPDIRKLGFHYVEMEGLGARHLRSMYSNRNRLLKTLDDLGLHVHNFCIVEPELVSLNPAKRERAIDLFKVGAELGHLLGVETLHLASYTPPVHYLKAKPYQLRGGKSYQFVNSTQVRIPRGFDWDCVWNALVDSCQRCADVSAQYGKTVIMEPRVGEVICSVDSLLRLIEYVQRRNFKANFDTGHFSAQRENIPLALAKLRGHFANIHISDNDPADSDHLPIGEGTIDWSEFFRVLKNMKYDGFLGLDLGPSRSMRDDYRKSVERVMSVACDLGLTVEI